MNIFNEVIKTPVTNTTLERMLTAYKKVKTDPDTKPASLKNQLAGARALQILLGKGAGKYAKTDLQKLLTELRTVCAIIDQLMHLP
jgi:hypothetical protein